MISMLGLNWNHKIQDKNIQQLFSVTRDLKVQKDIFLMMNTYNRSKSWQRKMSNMKDKILRRKEELILKNSNQWKNKWPLFKKNRKPMLRLLGMISCKWKWARTPESISFWSRTKIFKNSSIKSRNNMSDQKVNQIKKNSNS